MIRAFLHSRIVHPIGQICPISQQEAAWPVKLGAALIMAALTGLAAQVRIPLPYTPVPLTGQTFVVLLSGVVLGGAWGAASQILYVGLGAVGMPWFAGGVAVQPLGPTAGYLLGFIVAAMLVGRVLERFPAMRRFFPQLALMFVGMGVIHLFGAIGFLVLTGAGLSATVQMAVLPFVLADAGKAVAAAMVGRTLLRTK
ncbi:MAG: biotin transporter BioY [Candidatus Sumerlaeia bacterium]|nr:biotin transporter BioY [Candidatus Sumerlaeia bacterium]